MKTLEVGTRIYYGGDMANHDDFGTIRKVTNDKWGLYYEIKLDDGRVMKGIHHVMFSEKYLGHGGTRFVTEASYDEFRSERLAELQKRMSA